MNLHVYEKTEMRVAEAQPSSVPPSPTSDLLGLSWAKAGGMTRLPPQPPTHLDPAGAGHPGA
jgi:hypothetical protein